MKLVILRENLKLGLVSVEKTISENTNLPILKNILLKTTDNKIQITATNLELGINHFIPAKVSENGGLTVPFNTFFSIVSNLDSERIILEVEKNILIIKTDNYQARIQGINQEEFPIMPKIEKHNNDFEINSTILKNAFSEIVSAARISEIRPEISGVLFDFQITIIKLVATDSFRLAEKTIYDHQFKTRVDSGLKMIIPLKTIQEIMRVFPEDQSLNAYFDSNQIIFQTDNQEIISRLIDGQYPDYESIVPKKIDTEIIVNKEKFLTAVKLVGSLTGKNNDLKIKSKDNSKILEIYSVNQELGENNYLIPAKITGPDFKEIAFNWRYIIDGLKAIKSENVFLGLSGDTKPAFIKAPEEASYFYLLMPIKSS